MIVLSYNHARFILEALESVKAQTYETTELIIIDDCSTDESVATINRWLEENGIEATFIRHQKNQGICKSLNEALGVVQGKYISMIASDDMWLPDKIARQVEVIENLSSDYGVVFSDAHLIGEHGDLLHETFHSKYTPFFKPTDDYNYFEGMLQGNIIHGLASIYRTQTLLETGGYDEKLFAEDWDMHIRLSLRTKIYFNNSQISCKYRIVSNSANHNPSHRLRAVDSSFDSLIKFYGITPRGNLLIINTLNEFTWELYQHNHKNWRAKFAKVYHLEKSATTFKRYLLSKLHINYRSLMFLWTFRRKIVGKIGLSW
jgi:glycosyltransferase involved in cell wall biosynthesis